jgi:hypothetical protein
VALEEERRSFGHQVRIGDEVESEVRGNGQIAFG